MRACEDRNMRPITAKAKRNRLYCQGASEALAKLKSHPCHDGVSSQTPFAVGSRERGRSVTARKQPSPTMLRRCDLHPLPSSYPASGTSAVLLGTLKPRPPIRPSTSCISSDRRSGFGPGRSTSSARISKRQSALPRTSPPSPSNPTSSEFCRDAVCLARNLVRKR
jgi:hypothetical protein